MQGLLRLTVALIAEDRVSCDLQMDTNLILSTGDGLAQKNRDAISHCENLKAGERWFSRDIIRSGKAMVPVSATIDVCRNTSIDLEGLEFRDSFDDSEVCLLNQVLLEELLKLPSRFNGLRQQ
jgi:hypothetical protein